MTKEKIAEALCKPLVWTNPVVGVWRAHCALSGIDYVAVSEDEAISIDATRRARLAAALDLEKVAALVEAASPFSLPDESDESIAVFQAEHPEEGGHVKILRSALTAFWGRP